MDNQQPSILERYMPADVLTELKDRFAMVCRPPESGATVIRPELLSGLHVVVLSIDLIPNSNPPSNFSWEYIALVLLHELAHVYLGHRPPSTDLKEEDAYALALRWFNQTQETSMTLRDLKELMKRQDGFWLYGSRDQDGKSPTGCGA